MSKFSIFLVPSSFLFIFQQNVNELYDVYGSRLDTAAKLQHGDDVVIIGIMRMKISGNTDQTKKQFYPNDDCKIMHSSKTNV